MKITIFSPGNRPSGGVQRIAYELEKRLKLKGADVKIVPPPSLLPIPGRAHLNSMFLFPLYTFFKSLEEHASIFHFLAPEFCNFLPLIKGKKVVTFHDLNTLKGLETNYLLAKQYCFTFMIALKFSDMIIVDSKQTEEEVINFFPWARNKIKIVHPGVDKKFIPLKKKVALKRYYYHFNGKVIGYLGALGKRKRVDKLILDFKNNWKEKDTILAIWGSGKQEKYLQYLAKNDPRIRFMGFAPEEEIVRIYNSFDAFCFPTEYEGFGLPIVEAVACGIPTFIYKDAKISEEVRKYAFEIESVREIPEILENISERELKKRSKEIKKEFDWNKTVNETIKVYKEVIR